MKLSELLCVALISQEIRSNFGNIDLLLEN